MRINNNIPALQAYTSMLTTNRKVDRSTIRLSSGIRINSVKDDAAGMAISNKLSFQIAGIEMAARNTMDGISVVQVAEGALQEVQNMLQRVRELSVQSSNDTNTAEDRWKMDEEARQLIDEISATASKTEYNQIKLLFGDAARMAKTPEADRPYVKITYVSDAVPNDTLEYNVLSFGLPASVTSTGGNFATQADVDALVGQSIKMGKDGFSVSAEDTPQSLMKKFEDLLFTKDLLYKPINGGALGGFASGDELIIYTKDSGADQYVEISGDAALLAALGLTAGKTTGKDAELDAPNLAVGSGAGAETYSYKARGNHIEMEASNGKRITMELQISKHPNDAGEFETLAGGSIGNVQSANPGVDAGVTGPPPIPTFTATAKAAELLNFGQFQLHIGPNKNQVLKMQIPAMTMEAMHIEYLHLKSWEGAQRAIGQCDSALQYVSDTRGRLGAYQNRLEHTHDSLGVTGENTSGALSRIYDTDMAKEISLYTTNNVIMQAGMAMLAQANQRPQQVLQLLS